MSNDSLQTQKSQPGIGRSVAVHFAKEGANIAIVYTPKEVEDAQETKRYIESLGQGCLLIEGDSSQWCSPWSDLDSAYSFFFWRRESQSFW